MDRMIHKAMPIFIVEMPEWRLSDHGESAANSAQNCYREGSRQCDRLLPTPKPSLLLLRSGHSTPE